MCFCCIVFKENSEKKIQLNELGLSELIKERDELKNLINSLHTQLDDINLEKVLENIHLDKNERKNFWKKKKREEFSTIIIIRTLKQNIETTLTLKCQADLQTMKDLAENSASTLKSEHQLEVERLKNDYETMKMNYENKIAQNVEQVDFSN